MIRRNRWGIAYRVGLHAEARTGRDGKEPIGGTIVRIDRASDFARAYGPQVTIAHPRGLQTIGADGLVETRAPHGIVDRWGTVLRVYDNSGRSFDRFTVIPPRWADRETWGESYGRWFAIGASERPFHPQGFGQCVSASPGPHLGRRIHWQELPEDVQRFARQTFPEFAPKA